MKKILLIDDEADLVESLKKTLESNGYEVYGALNGKEGYEKAQEERPHLILLDIIMPDMDGFEVLKRLRNAPATALTNIIMCTARGDTSSILKAEKSYATDYIIKPFELSELMELIKKYI
jgi:DNA-binding response OmpR family regulator